MNKKQINNSIFVEKYRPKSVEHIILPQQYRRAFNKYISEKKIPNLMFFSSSPGTGKTSLAKAICNDIEADYLYINAASESGIDTLRGKIAQFASTKSFDGGRKVVILDEMSSNSRHLQDGLKSFLEEFHRVCNFIFTTNYITQVVPPLKSRCQIYDMNFTEKKIVNELKPKILKRIFGILKKENVEYDEKVVTDLVDKNYPDIRKIIQTCQQYGDCNDGLIDEGVLNFEEVEDEFYQFLLNKKFRNARQYLIEKNINYDAILPKIYHEFVPMLDKSLQPKAIILIAQYQYQQAFAIDKEINFAALMLELMQL